MEVFNKLEKVLFNADSDINDPAFKIGEAELQEADCREHFKTAKKFLLDVEKAQSFYDGEHNFQFKEFVLPFDNCIFAFEKPLIIKWMKRERAGYGDHKLLAINIFRTREFQAGFKKPIQEYKAYLHFEEEWPVENHIVISHQFIKFVVIVNDKENGIFIHIDHYPCQNKILCQGEDDTWIKRGYIKLESKVYNCQEILTRDSLIDTLITLVNKIHEVTVVEKKKHTGRDDIVRPPKIPRELLMVKKEIPKEGYSIPLEGKRYKYDPEEIAYGTGTKHQYRYDVRRHPRIVNNKLIWVSEHTRGSGSYIQGVRTNTRTWFINYIWYQAEKLTKYRVFEILFIKFMKWFKK